MGMFNFYDEQAKTQASPLKTGMSYAALSPGRGSVALAGQAGQMMGQGAMGAMGLKTPAQEKQEALMAIQAQFPNPQTAQEFMQIGNALMNIDPDRAKMAFDQADDMTTTTDTMTPAMKNIRDIAKLNLQCDIKNPEIIKDGKNCYQLSTEAYLKVKRVGDEEQGKTGGVKSFQETLGKVRETQTTLRRNLSTLTSLKALVPQIYTGTGQGAVAAWNKVGTILGFADATDAQAATEAFRSGGLQVAMDYINATKGAVSDMEMTKFIEASPNLQNTKLGNLFIIEFSIARQEREQRLLSAMAAFSRKYPGATTTDWLIKEDELLQSEEYDISKKLQKAYDNARKDPKYTGLTTEVVTEGDASTDTESMIQALEKGLQ